MNLKPKPKGVKRRYSSPRREEQARATRRAILESAIELFTSQGFASTSVKQIADRASVTAQTVYNAFQDKIGVLCGAGILYIESGGSAEEEALLEALRAESDPATRIAMVAEDSRATWESGALELDNLMFGTEIRDPRLDELAEKSLAYKLESARSVCEILFPDSIRRPGLELDTIAVFLTAVDSASTVSTVLRLGWTMDQWEEWAVQLLSLFLDPSVAHEGTDD